MAQTGFLLVPYLWFHLLENELVNDKLTQTGAIRWHWEGKKPATWPIQPISLLICKFFDLALSSPLITPAWAHPSPASTHQMEPTKIQSEGHRKWDFHQFDYVIGSGRPKGVSFGVSAERDWFQRCRNISAKIHLSAERDFRQKWYLSAEIPTFGRMFRPKFDRNKYISAERYFFRLLSVLSVCFGFRPKFKLSKSALSVSAETLSVDLYLKCRNSAIGTYTL